MIHEIAHWQLCAPERRPLYDFGLGAGPESGRVEEADRVMALAGGASKTEAIAGALKLGIIDVLVTDKFTAARLIA